MKYLVLALLAGFSAGAFAKFDQAANDRICTALQAKADDQCDHIMCDSLVADGSFKDIADCTSASDYGEAAQATCEDVLPGIVADYNKKHSNAQVKCD